MTASNNPKVRSKEEATKCPMSCIVKQIKTVESQKLKKSPFTHSPKCQVFVIFKDFGMVLLNPLIRIVKTAIIFHLEGIAMRYLLQLSQWKPEIYTLPMDEVSISIFLQSGLMFFRHQFHAKQPIFSRSNGSCDLSSVSSAYSQCILNKRPQKVKQEMQRCYS